MPTNMTRSSTPTPVLPSLSKEQFAQLKADGESEVGKSVIILPSSDRWARGDRSGYITLSGVSVDGRRWCQVEVESGARYRFWRDDLRIAFIG